MDAQGSAAEKSASREASDALRAFGSGGEAGVRGDLRDLIAKRGADIEGDFVVLSSWEGAVRAPSPLWLVALSRSRVCSEVLVEADAPLGHPSGRDDQGAWRYAAFNGWAQESAVLFKAQGQAAPMKENWSAVWAAVSQGCQAQSEGFGERAAGWLGALLGSKIGAKEAKLLGSLGKAIGQAVPAVAAQDSSAGRPSGWELLVDEAEALWGPCDMAQARAALDGHSSARALALARCSQDAPAAQRQLDAMIAELAAESDEMSVAMRQAMGAAASPGTMVDAWAESKAECEAWGSAAAQLASQGARLPEGALDSACADGLWRKAYALAIGGAKLSGVGEPALWQLCKSRRQGTLSDALASAMGAAGGAVPNDSQALDVAEALARAGAKASAKGSDGLDALGELRSEQKSAAGSIFEALAALGIGGPAPAPAKALNPASRGLGALEDFLVSQSEREQLGEAAAEAPHGERGSQRL